VNSITKYLTIIQFLKRIINLTGSLITASGFYLLVLKRHALIRIFLYHLVWKKVVIQPAVLKLLDEVLEKLKTIK